VAKHPKTLNRAGGIRTGTENSLQRILSPWGNIPVRGVHLFRIELITPRIHPSIGSPRCLFPLGLRREADYIGRLITQPLAISAGVILAYIHDGVVFLACADGASEPMAWSFMRCGLRETPVLSLASRPVRSSLGTHDELRTGSHRSEVDILRGWFSTIKACRLGDFLFQRCPGNSCLSVSSQAQPLMAFKVLTA
jgi:hypothetical protein